MTDAPPLTQRSVVWSAEPVRGRRSAPAWSDDAAIAVDLDGDDSTGLPFLQPGPLDARNGWRSHRIELIFRLADVQPEYVLRLALHAVSGPCPQLSIQVGEHRGVFHPRVTRPTRDAVLGTGPIAGDAVVEFGIPGNWFTAGENRLTVATVHDEPLAEDDPRGFHRNYGGFGSALAWQSITLFGGAAAEPTVRTDVSATPFYVDGHELVDVTVTIAAGSDWPRQAELVVAGTTYPLALAGDGRDFGQARIRVPVSEFAGPTPVTVAIGQARFEQVLRPARKWTMHLIPHVHLDVGYTDYQGKVLELHSRNLDRALAILPKNPEFRFAADGALIVAEFLATRAPEQRERLLSALREKRISVNAFHSLFLSGLPTLEECYRYAYLAQRLRQEDGVPIDYANLTDVPSYTMAIPGILQALGIDAFIGIENHGRAANAESEQQHLVSPVWWEGPDGSRVLAFFSDQYSQLRHMVGDPQTLPAAADAFERFLARYEREDYLPHDLPIIGSHCDNEDLAAGDIDLVDRWNSAYTWPKLRISTFSDYLDTVRPFGDRLPSWHGDGGSYWEDGVGTAATAMHTYRRAQMLVPLAEGLAALTALHSSIFQPNRAALDLAWDGLLIGGEHTWTWAHGYHHPHADQTHDQEAWKRHRIATAHRTATDELRRTMSQLGELVTTDGPTVLIYNGLSWPRSVDAEFELTGSVDLPAEILHSDNGLDRMRVTVPDIPAFGYRAFPVRKTASESAEWERIEHLRTDRWDVTLDPSGRITGLVHLPTGRQLLDPESPWALADVLYVTEGDESARYAPSRLVSPHPTIPEPELDIAAAELSFVGARRTYDGWRLRATGSAPTLPEVSVDVLLRDASDRIDVTVTLDKQRALTREAVYVAFPFAASDPRVRWDRQQGWVDPTVDHTPGACNDWFTIQNAVTVNSGDGPGIAWSAADAPLFVVGDILRGRWATRFHTDNGTLLSWVMNNYWPTNTPPTQEGRVELRYAFRPTERFDPLQAGRFGREVRSPAVVSDVSWLDKDDTDPRPLDRAGATLLDLETPETVAATIFRAQDSDDLIVRLQDLSGRPGPVSIRLPDRECALCFADERVREPIAADQSGRVTVDLPAYGVATLRFT